MGQLRISSVIDYSRDRLDPDLWEGDPPVLKQSVGGEIWSRLVKWFWDHGFESANWLSGFYLIGSAATHQWTRRSDLDITVVIDPDAFRLHEQDVSPPEVTDADIVHICYEVSQLDGGLNEQDLTGTSHPVNYWFRTDLNDLEAADAGYDIMAQIWLRIPEPIPITFDPEVEFRSVWEQAQSIVTRLDQEIGETGRDVQDHDILEEYLSEVTDPVAISWVGGKVQEKIHEIESDLSVLSQDYDQVHKDRAGAFLDKSTNPTEILRSKNWLPQNIIYKYLERYGYVSLLRRLRQIHQSEPLKSDDIEEIKNVIHKSAYGEVVLKSNDFDAIAAALTTLAGVIYGSNSMELISTYASFRTALETLRWQLESEQRKVEESTPTPTVWDSIGPQEQTTQQVWDQILSPVAPMSTNPYVYGKQTKTAYLSKARWDWFRGALKRFEPVVKKSGDKSLWASLKRMEEILSTIGFVDRSFARDTYYPDEKYTRTRRTR